jgi:D-alanyl-D-alanine carboxypeptidase/D-alanyl-D-alanine-endopeptidase (penicillin-binding protein 4)
MKKIIGFFFVISLLVPTFVHAQPVLKAELDPYLKKILNKTGLSESDFTYSVIEVGSKKVLEEHQANQPFPLASVSKMLTVYFALEQLGPDFRFTTKSWHKGRIKDGVLNGDLYIEGDGDPLYTSPDLANLCFQIRLKEIRSMTGKVYWLGNRPTLKSEVSLLGLGDEPYNPSIAGLNLNFNRIDLKSTGVPENLYQTIPPLEHFNVQLSSEDFLPGQHLKFIPIPPNQENWLYNRNSKRSARLELPIKKPLYHFAAMMKFYCAQEGVQLGVFEAINDLPSGLDLIAEQRSIPLDELTRLTLEYSNNLLAESILVRAASQALKRPNITLIESGESLENSLLGLEGTIPETEKNEIEFVNGSGLTTENRASSGFFTRTLAKIENKSFGSRSFKSLLSLGGHNGWIKEKFNTPELTHRVWAKTGSLDYVNNLAGYIHNPNGKILAFSIFISDLEKRKTLDGPYDEKHFRLKSQAPAWKSKTHRLIIELIRHWNIRYGN